MAKRSRESIKHRFTPTSVSILLEKKREQDGKVAVGIAYSMQSELTSAVPFVPATARRDLTNPLATPGSGMFFDNSDQMAPAG